jgi:ligand-binding SRPBCC domain-containing protein
MQECVRRALAAGGRPVSHIEELHAETWVPAPVEKAFAFFADATNLERLTPAWLNFEIVNSAPIVMQAGTIIDYRIRLYGVPIPWQTKIEIWEPGVRFVDVQVAGPYRWWRHEHRFEASGSGTRVIDHVEYLPRARVLSGRIVRRDVERIFAFRQVALTSVFTLDNAGAPPVG